MLIQRRRFEGESITSKKQWDEDVHPETEEDAHLLEVWRSLRRHKANWITSHWARASTFLEDAKELPGYGKSLTLDHTYWGGNSLCPKTAVWSDQKWQDYTIFVGETPFKDVYEIARHYKVRLFKAQVWVRTGVTDNGIKVIKCKERLLR